MCKIAPLYPAKWGKTRVGLSVEILGQHCLILATYLTLKRTKKYSVALGVSLVVWGSDGVPLGCRCVRLPPLTQFRRVKTRVGLWVGILGNQCLILATYLTHRGTKKYSVVFGVFLVVWGL